MIEISYTEPYDLDIASTPENFSKLRETLLDLLHSSKKEMVVLAETDFNPAPYTHVIQRLVVRKADGPAMVAIRDAQEVVISGSVEALDVFSSFLEFEDDAKFPSHNHFEYYDGHPAIHRDSIPIVISIAKEA